VRDLIFASLLVLASATASAAGRLVVHEWGTITTIHDAKGTPQGGLNRIDESEVLPDFVHRYEPETTRFDPKLKLGKLPRVPGRPDVTLRLETPVIYFYPPPNEKFDRSIDLRVRFRGGVINEFYPSAAASVALDTQRVLNKSDAGVLTEWNGDVLNNFVVGSLQWRGIELHDRVVAPLTQSPVWLAPREVHSTGVYLPAAGEGESFLFYRGVAHLDALLQTRLNRGGVQLLAPAQFAWLESPTITLADVWFADVRADGKIAFREQGALTLSQSAPGREAARLKGFGNTDYGDRSELRQSLRRALIRSGLFADEADALLNTWQASYFEKPGKRVFYLVPREWTDYFLPLELSVPADVTRVIVGRIDLVESAR
jgi:hypothetical protein